MKQLAILSTSLLIALTTLQVIAQEEVKKEIKQTKKEIKETKKEKKGERKEYKTELKTQRKELRALRGEIVSERSKTQLNVDFKNISNVQWERTKYYDEATFEKDDKKMKAYYDIESTLIGTITDKTFDDLPTPSKKEIKKRYRDYTVQRVILFNDNNAKETDMLLYGMQFADADHYFVELTKDKKTIVLIVSENGLVAKFTEQK